MRRKQKRISSVRSRSRAQQAKSWELRAAMRLARLWCDQGKPDLFPVMRALVVVQGLLGHSQVRMTQRYAHLAPQTLLDAAEVVATVISGDAAASTTAQ